MNTYPPACPHCGTDITHVRPKTMRAPRDVREREPPSRGQEAVEQTVSLRCLVPCDHCYRTEDIRAWRNGRISTVELGDRVQNPATRTE